jgi:transposase
MTSIGIDVGAKELAVAIRHNGALQKNTTFSNNSTGHQQIVKLCFKFLKYGTVKIAMEATGVYFFDLAIALSQSGKLDVKVVNPRATKAFGQAFMERNKTDKIDAQILAMYVEKIDLPTWKKPSQQALTLRYISRAIGSLVEDKAATKNNLHALESCSEAPSIVHNLIKKKIDFFEKEIEKLRAAALSLISEDTQLKKWYELLLTVKGFGEASSIQFLGEAIAIPEGLTHKQWAAYAGLDPRQFQSGTSVKKKPGISKAGNRRLRKILFMPAMSAAYNDPHVKGYYQHLVTDQGLAKLQAIIAVMRKLLHAIHGMFHQLKPFDNTRFYATPFVG